MHWLWLLACGTPSPSTPEGDASAEPQAVAKDAPERQPADDILDRHNTETRQCALLDRATWTMGWDAKTNDGHSKVTETRIQYQGRTGVSFTRAQQQMKPQMRFVAFGRTPQGVYWSAGDQGIQTDLPPAVVAPMASAIDPTPLCAYAKRWPTRTVAGEMLYNGEEAVKVDLAWVDQSVTEMWFSKATGFLLGSRSEVGETSTETKLHAYQKVKGDIQWPGREVAVTKAGELSVTTEQVLRGFDLDPKGFGEMGPEQVASAMGVKLPEKDAEKKP